MVAVALVVPIALPGRADAGEGMEVLCDKAGWSCTAETGPGYRGQGVWGANHGRTGHNCTSYVSYLLSRRGVAQPWRPMGDAGRWDDNARRSGVRVDDVPAVGAVAQWDGGSRIAPGPSGHVAHVDAVGKDSIDISDDSYGGTGTRRLRIERGSPYWPDHFVHIADVGGDRALLDGRWLFAGVRVLLAKPAASIEFGEPGDVPVVGDWDGDGDDTVGVFRDGTWTIANVNSGKKMRPRTFTFGEPGDVPVVGDWDGDGRDTVGVFRDGTWRLAKSNRSDTSFREVHLGQADDEPLVGDWDGDGRDTFGTFRDAAWSLTNSPFASTLRLVQFTFGQAGDRPVVGDWDGVRGDSIGLYRDGDFHLASDNTPFPRRTKVVHFDGGAGSVPLAGTWDRRRNDTVGVVQ